MANLDGAPTGGDTPPGTVRLATTTRDQGAPGQALSGRASGGGWGRTPWAKLGSGIEPVWGPRHAWWADVRIQVAGSNRPGCKAQPLETASRR
ncbi:hypothetical protein ACCO45_002324 [Purpureocillium lilacinum]|uniref:Uncharacterized protein n=1 Tax=Purpureocillium lilacinum TaxID=33203 RepID=A0ACC4E9K7_PURLI